MWNVLILPSSWRDTGCVTPTDIWAVLQRCNISEWLRTRRRPPNYLQHHLDGTTSSACQKINYSFLLTTKSVTKLQQYVIQSETCKYSCPFPHTQHLFSGMERVPHLTRESTFSFLKIIWTAWSWWIKERSWNPIN